MIRSLQWRAFGLHRSSSRILPLVHWTIPATTRAASLSAIHRGVRRSERAQYGEARPTRSSTRGQRDFGDTTEKALEGASSKRQRLKLLRKLKRKHEEEDGTGKTTRRKRFVDPTTDFGKNSLVYQLKHGPLKNLTNKLDQPVRPRSFREKRREGRDPRDASRERMSANEFRDRAFGSRNNEEGEDMSKGRRIRDAPRERNPPTGSGGRAFSNRDRGEGDNLSSTQGPDDRHDVAKPPPRQRKGSMMPMAIKYTTAASQFLYGRSVVKAALEQARRKLYNLYIYDGDNRQETKDTTTISRLAQKRGIPVTMVPNEDQRLMDKMSQGRPHNGFVLETSPLPQLPVASLGKLEESPSRLGFHVELDHQTKEEEAINGTDTFIRRSSHLTTRPLVLLLDEILDPGNLGALLRTASYLGVDAVGITNRSSSNLTPVVLKSAAGAVEEITIFTVDSPVKFLEDSKTAGWKSFAAVAPPSRKLARIHDGKFVSTEDIEKQSPLADSPCILALGNEGHGLSKQLKMAADYELSVPRFIQESCVDSLNVSVAAGLLCHAFIKAPVATSDVKKQQDRGEAVDPKAQTKDEETGYDKKANRMF